VVNNAKGIQNVWLGEYKRADGSMVKGASLREAVATLDTALAEKVTQQISTSVAATEAIQAPFDREITGTKEAPGRLRIQKIVDSLTLQSQDLVTAANAMGITKLTLVSP
jgi:putative iron-regulated protein